MTKVNLREKLTRFDALWSPKIVADMNGYGASGWLGPFWPWSVLWIPGITLQAAGTTLLWVRPVKSESSKSHRHRGV